MAIKAKFAGTCARTGQGYRAGALIEKGDKGWELVGATSAAGIVSVQFRNGMLREVEIHIDGRIHTPGKTGRAFYGKAALSLDGFDPSKAGGAKYFPEAQLQMEGTRVVCPLSGEIWGAVQGSATEFEDVILPRLFFHENGELSAKIGPGGWAKIKQFFTYESYADLADYHDQCDDFDLAEEYERMKGGRYRCDAKDIPTVEELLGILPINRLANRAERDEQERREKEVARVEAAKREEAEKAAKKIENAKKRAAYEVERVEKERQISADCAELKARFERGELPRVPATATLFAKSHGAPCETLTRDEHGVWFNDTTGEPVTLPLCVYQIGSVSACYWNARREALRQLLGLYIAAHFELRLSSDGTLYARVEARTGRRPSADGTIDYTRPLVELEPARDVEISDFVFAALDERAGQIEAAKTAKDDVEKIKCLREMACKSGIEGADELTKIEEVKAIDKIEKGGSHSGASTGMDAVTAHFANQIARPLFRVYQIWWSRGEDGDSDSITELFESADEARARFDYFAAN